MIGFFMLLFLIIGGTALMAMLVDEFTISKLIILIIAICVLLGLVKIGDKLDKSPVEWNIEWQTNIIALKDNSDIQGNIYGGIFVTSGQIGEETYYYCMESTNEGKHMIKIPSDKAYITETNDKTSGIIKKSEHWKNNKLDFWMCPKTGEKYYIYVPVGTIDTTYKVDME